MSISSLDLYQPISEFFLAKYGSGSQAEVEFRFDKFGSVLTDADFIDENYPERGLQKALADEKFSDLVNRVPLDAGDGKNVVLTGAAIDDIYYYELLAPSIVAFPSGADEYTKASATKSFEAIKARALKDWELSTASSTSGLAVTFKRSIAEPEDWFNTQATSAWATQVFNIGSPETRTAASSPPLWRFAPAVNFLARELQVDPESVGASTPATRKLILDSIAARPLAWSQQVKAARPIRRAHNQPAATIDLLRVYQPQLTKLRFSDRVVINQKLQEVAPQAPVTTTQVSISFDYCLVRITRPWWMDVFVNSVLWRVPTLDPGEITMGKDPGSIPWLPVAFIATRNLIINAEWSREDSERLSLAKSFGPFHIESTKSQTLTHEGIQVVGWLLQSLPALPPKPELAAIGAAESPRKYTVRAGDTLWKIALEMYGDGEMYPKIQVANKISNPRQIRVGKTLLIP